MSAARLRGWLGLSLVLLLSACPQGAPEQRAASHSDSTSPGTGPVTDDAPASARSTRASDAPSETKRPGRRIRTGGPLPPQRMPEPVMLDRSCKTDSDCAVKNVGSCCGAYPDCVNVDSPADPAAVQAQCAREGKASICGFREVSACQCARGSCMALPDAINPSSDPAPPPPAER